MGKECPLTVVPAKTVVAGYTQLTVGRRVLKTWNPTTKKYDVLVRQAIVQGPGGEKRFYGKPWQLLP